MTAVVLVAEQQAHPGLQALGVDQAASLTQAGGNMEGKETRFGISASALFAAVTTAASCGAVNAMHDSFIADRRHGAAGADAAGRSGVRRRRLRPVHAC